jgi:hypothetical protein
MGVRGSLTVNLGTTYQNHRVKPSYLQINRITHKFLEYFVEHRKLSKRLKSLVTKTTPKGTSLLLLECKINLREGSFPCLLLKLGRPVKTAETVNRT